VEVIVIDDCSGDGTADFLADLTTPYRLVALRHEANEGRAAARNTGIRAATGEIVLFLDDDMRADPRLVAAHVESHGAHPHSAVIGNALTAPELGGSNLFRYMDTRGVHKLRPGAPSPARYLLTNNASVPRDALLEAGLFDEAFESYGFEDTELAIRLEERAGLEFWYAPSATAYHIHHHSIDQFLEKRLSAARSSLPYLLEKHPGRAGDLSVDALTPFAPSDGPWLRLRKIVVSVLLARPIERLARRLVAIQWLGRCAYPLFDYLVAASYHRGLTEAKALGRLGPA